MALNQHKKLSNARDRITMELDSGTLTTEQRIDLLKTLAELEIQLCKLGKHRYKIQKASDERRGRKRTGRPKKLYDDAGNPLYQGVPPKETENEDPKLKFLSTLTEETTDATE
jgi:hypothetical protein